MSFSTSAVMCSAGTKTDYVSIYIRKISAFFGYCQKILFGLGFFWPKLQVRKPNISRFNIFEKKLIYGFLAMSLVFWPLSLVMSLAMSLVIASSN